MVMLEIMARWEKLQARVVIHTELKTVWHGALRPYLKRLAGLKKIITAANAGQSLEYVDPFLP